MYVLQNVKTVSSASLFEHLLLLSGDIEVCPEPTREIPELDTRDWNDSQLSVKTNQNNNNLKILRFKQINQPIFST